MSANYQLRAYDPSIKQFVVRDETDVNDGDIAWYINPKFDAMMSAIMTSSTPFCFSGVFIIIYSRMRIWIYYSGHDEYEEDLDIFDKTMLLSYKPVPDRFAPYINMDEATVTLYDECVCIHQGRNLLVMPQYGDVVTAPGVSVLYRLPPGMEIVGRVPSIPPYDHSYAAKILVHDLKYKRHYYGSFEYGCVSVGNWWWFLPGENYIIHGHHCYQVTDGVETLINPRSCDRIIIRVEIIR